MRKDAFDDLGLERFDYVAELNEARETLRRKIGVYVRNNPKTSIRELSEAFHLSLGAISEIVKKYRPGRKIGRPPGRQVIFDLILWKKGQKHRRLVAIRTSEKGITEKQMRKRVIEFYGAARAPLSKRRSRDGCEVWDYRKMVIPQKVEQRFLQRGSEIEMDISLLLQCIENGSTSKPGDIACKYVKRWMDEHHRRKTPTHNWAQSTLEKYKTLPQG
jgi:hypothetical protein